MRTFWVWLAVTWSSAAADREPILMGESLTFDSKILSEERAVQVWLPKRYFCCETRYPVLYVLDGKSHFLHASGTVEFLATNRIVPEMIVVAVCNTDRVRDFTPPVASAEVDDSSLEVMFPNHGGADRFLAFLCQELVPLIDKTYRTEPFRILCGHSFGGLFTVHTFLSNTDSFQGFIAASPCLSWDNQRVVQRADAFLKQVQNLRRTLYVTMGREESKVAEGIDAFRGILEAHSPEGLVWSTLHLGDETHSSVVLRSLYFGLKTVFDGWSVPRAKLVGDLKGVQEHFQSLSPKYGYTLKPPEELINQMGYAALAREDVKRALEILEFNTRTHSSSANVFDSYAEALEIDQQVKKAQKNYEKAYQLALKMNDPLVSVYKRNLDRVTEKLELAKKNN